MAQLYPFEKPLQFGEGALGPNEWRALCLELVERCVENVIEVGAGYSTLLLDRAGFNVQSYEMHPEWLAKMQALVTKRVTLHSYNYPKLPKPGYNKRHAVLVDGPANTSDGRYHSMAMAGVSAPIVFVHDAVREADKAAFNKVFRNEHGPTWEIENRPGMTIACLPERPEKMRVLPWDLAGALQMTQWSMTTFDAELLEKACETTGATRVLEIGARYGSSGLVFANQMRKTGGMLWSIDVSPRTAYFNNMREFGLSGYSQLVGGASPWVTIPDLPEQIDVLLVDDDHSTLSCLMSYGYWKKWLRKGGVVVFHDYYGAAHYQAAVQKAVEMILARDKLTKLGEAKGRSPRGCYGSIAFVKDF